MLHKKLKEMKSNELLNFSPITSNVLMQIKSIKCKLMTRSIP
jgi:hypothetical protein